MAQLITPAVPLSATSVLSALPSTAFAFSCASNLVNNTAFTSGLVDRHGLPMSVFSNETWGIDINTCDRFCNATVIPMDFNFETFASTITNYFLPFLALCAQLPYECHDNFSNVMSFFLALGSPALATFSLTLTILNRHWVRERFDKLWERSQELDVRDKFASYGHRIRAAQFLLQEAQQVPLRASQERGWFSSLIVVPENQNWWMRLQERLRATRRGITPSLVAQIGLAGISYLLTVIASFRAQIGDPATALQISAGSLWIWLIPVILGWVLVGTQSSATSIPEALKSDQAHRALEPPLLTAETYSSLEGQKGLRVRSGLTPQPRNQQSVFGAFETLSEDNLKIPNWAGLDVRGDERRSGPIYNYARVLTWYQVAASTAEALRATLTRIEKGEACRSPFRSSESIAPWNSTGRAEDNLAGDSWETSRYCGMTAEPILAYPPWAEIPGEVWKRVIAASAMGIFVSWGTTGPSIIIAWYTPTVGLGCRSGSYILYGSLSTLVLLCLWASMLLSHAAMLRYQEVHKSNPSMDFRIRGQDDNPNAYARDLSHSCLCGAAVILRYCGKSIAVINALWLIVSSVLEFIGGYDNCWCSGDRLGDGRTGWVLLFKSAGELSDEARLPWGMGFAASLLVCLISYTFFHIGSANNRRE